MFQSLKLLPLCSAKAHFNLLLAIGELLEFFQAPSFDEFGDFLFFLGINNPWSIRKILWRDPSVSPYDIASSKFMLEYVELSKRSERISLYEFRCQVLFDPSDPFLADQVMEIMNG